MIEVGAHLIGGPVYFSGEKISCRITFSNVHHKEESHQNNVQGR